MKTTILRYGIGSAVFIVLFSALNLMVFRDRLSYSMQEVAGYLTILLACSFIFFGIRHYKIRHNNGKLTFWQGMKTGTLILLFPSLLMAVFGVLYTEVIHPGWNEEYRQQYLGKIKDTMPAAEFESKLQELDAQAAFYDHPAMQFGVMFLTVFVIGMIVTIISAVTLRWEGE